MATAQKAVCSYAQKQIDDAKYDKPCCSYEEQIQKGLFLKFCLENIDCYTDEEQDKLISVCNRFSQNCGGCVITDAALTLFKTTAKGKELTSRFLTLDPDVAYFISMNGLSDTTEIDALDLFVKALKSASLWTKFHSIHPFVGTSLGAKAYNLKNPATFLITWGSGAINTTKGVDFDGTTDGYGDLNLNFATLGYTSTTDIHVSFYTPDGNTIARNIGWGAQTSAGNDRITMVFDGIGANHFVDIWSDNTTARLTISGDAGNEGWYMTSTASASDLRVRRNASALASTTALRDINPVPNFDLFIGAINSANTPTFGTTRTFGIFTSGYNLTDSESDAAWTIINTYLTSLNRK